VVYVTLRVSVGVWIDAKDDLLARGLKGEQWPYRSLRARRKISRMQLVLIRVTQVVMIGMLVLVAVGSLVH
jgi:hypothetical protein